MDLYTSWEKWGDPLDDQIAWEMAQQDERSKEVNSFLENLEIQDFRGLYLILDQNYDANLLGQPLKKLLATIITLKNSSVSNFYASNRDQLFKSKDKWFQNITDSKFYKKFQDEKICTDQFKKNLMAFIYIDNCYNICEVLNKSSGENIEFKAFKQREFKNLAQISVEQKDQLETLKKTHFCKDYSQLHPILDKFFEENFIYDLDFFNSLIFYFLQSKKKMQRLAWIGDVILWTFVHQIRYEDQYKYKQFQIINQKISKYVSRATLAKVAKELTLEDYIQKNFQRQVGNDFLAELIEALIAYLFFKCNGNVKDSCNWLTHSEQWCQP